MKKKTKAERDDREIEVKVLEIDPAGVENKLRKIGARLVFDRKLRTVFLDNENALAEKKALVRLRDDGRNTVLTYKKHIEQKKVRKSREIEVKVSDFNQMLKILKSLGFSKKSEYFKKRKHFVLDEMVFEIDSVAGIPDYLEIEGPSERDVLRYAKILGFSKKDVKNWTGRQLAEHYGKAL
jgi:adenylate cyclase class 2